jgi:cysteine synthase A
VLEQLLGRRCGGSTGTNLVGALQLMCELHASGERGPVVTLICDGGERYRETYYNDAWLAGEGFDVTGEQARLEQIIQSGRWIDA